MSNQSSVLNEVSDHNLGAGPRSVTPGSHPGTGMSSSGLVSGATSSELQRLATYMGISLDLVDQLRMTDLDSVHARDATISWADKLTHRRALEQALSAKTAGGKKSTDATTTAVVETKGSKTLDIPKLISRAKDAGKVSGGIFKGSQDTRSVAVFLDEIDSTDEYACGTAAFKYFYLRANLDEDIRGYVNKEVKAKVNKEGVSAENWTRKLSLLRSILLDEYTMLSSDLATQLEWDKLVYTSGSSRMESHLTKLLTLADRISMSRGSQVSDRELRSKLYASLPTATQRWIDSLGSSTVESYAAMRREVRRWAQYNEKPVGSSRRSTSVPRGGKKVQVSVANTMENSDDVGLSIALGDMDKDACGRCGLKGHRAFECRGNVYQSDKRCCRCGSFDHALSQCPLSPTTICGRCKQPGHYSATCNAELPVKRFNPRNGRGSRTPTLMVANSEGDGNDVHPPTIVQDTAKREVVDSASVPVMQVDLLTMNSSLHDQDPLEVKIVPPAQLSADVAGREVKFLIDSGAGLNFINEALATELSALSNQPFRPLARELRVVFGNDHKVLVSRGLELPLSVIRHGKKECVLVSFVIMPNLNPSALIGRPGICDLALSVHGFVPTQTASEVAVCSIDPVETIEVAGKGKRLLAHCPRLEESRPELHVEPQRRRPDRERKAIYRLLCLMEKEEKVVRLQPGQAWTINEVVLVAKKGAESWKCLPGILDREDDEQLLAHFRVTLDLRFTNKIGATTPTLETENESKLSQYGVHDLIGSLPSHHGAFFGRIDLRDAFHGVYISKKMQQHMATRVLNDQGVEVIFAWNRLPMGYKQSSGLFGRSVELMLIEAREALRKLNIDCSLRSLQDDCIVAGPTASAVNEALDVLIRVVRSYGFECRNSKVQRATDHLVFCGHQISGRESGLPLLTPCPQRRDLSSAGFEAEWEIFIKKCKSSSAKLKFLRKWAGVFQWFSHWLGGLEQDALRCLNKAVKCLQNNDAVDDEQWEKVSVAWHTLAQSFMSGLASLYLGHCIATLIVTDSNVESWYGAILGVVTLDSDNACPALFPELEERLYDISPCDDLFPMPPTGKIFRVLPVRLCGGVWKKREQLRSSTWRERGAQLQCVSENLDALRGDHVISLNDNANLCKTWRDVQGDFGYASEPYAGVWIKRWELFEAYVDKCVWLPREVDALCWTDMSARKLAAGDSADGMIGEVEIAPVDVNNSSGQLNVDDMTKEEVNDIYGCSVVSDDKMHSILVTFSGQPSYEDALSWLSSKQKEDEQLAKIRVSCEKEHKESREFLVEKDCLFHLGRWRADEPVIKQAVLPDCGGLRSTILGEFHEYGIHGSAQLLSGMVQQAYWWPTLRKDCKVFVRKCEVCQRSTKCASDICISRSGQRLQVPLPWYSVGSDVFMLGRELEAEFNLHWTAMLTITCAFTGFTVLVPLPQPVDSACIINAYLYAFSLYGYPRHLRCDGGANLVSQDVNSWLLAHGVSSTVAVGYSPWTGGYYERRHRDLAATLRKFLLDLKYGTGAMYVNSPYALAAMLQGQLNSYGIDWRGARDTTSQMLMTGTIPRPPASLDDIAPRDNWSSQGIFGEINLKEASGEDVALREAKLVEVLRKRATDIRKRRDECLRDFNTVWLERREEARNRFDQTLARKQTKELLKIGDKVLLAERFPSKFAPRWSKPREVVALRGLRCIVKNDDGTLRELHLRYVKKFHSGEEVQPVTTSKRDRPDDIEDHEDGDQGEVQQDDKSPATSSAVRTRPVRKCSRMTSYAHQL